jgi:Zinc-binding loop region of homing endonuclease
MEPRKRRRVDEEKEYDRTLLISKFSYTQVIRTWLHMLKFNLTEESAAHITWGVFVQSELYGQRSSIMKDSRAEQIEALMYDRKEPSFPPDQCLFVNLKAAASSKNRGQQEPRVRKGIIGEKNVNVMAYHIPLRMYAGEPSVGDTASHLCHNHLCINPAHLVWESHALNNMRNTCNMVTTALRHSGSNEKFKCIHNPVCFGCEPMADADQVRAWMKQNPTLVYKQ